MRSLKDYLRGAPPDAIGGALPMIVVSPLSFLRVTFDGLRLMYFEDWWFGARSVFS